MEKARAKIWIRPTHVYWIADAEWSYSVLLLVLDMLRRFYVKLRGILNHWSTMLAHIKVKIRVLSTKKSRRKHNTCSHGTGSNTLQPGCPTFFQKGTASILMTVKWVSLLCVVRKNALAQSSVSSFSGFETGHSKIWIREEVEQPPAGK